MAGNGKNTHAQIKKRIEALIKKAEDGDIYSMRLIACMYSEGEYLPKDTFAAEAWYRKAAELGSDVALKELAKLLTKGKGVAQDLEGAFEIYQELMMDFDTDGIAGVGIAYKLGLGVPKDEERGSKYILEAFRFALDTSDDEIN